MTQQQRLGRLATKIRHENGMTVIRLYATDVVSFNDEFIKLNAGGYRTNTTKTRMNQASNQFGLGYYVSQENFDWFVTFKGEKRPFVDNMILVRKNKSESVAGYQRGF